MPCVISSLSIRLKQFLRKILKIVLQEINDKNGTDYQQKDVYFEFKREVMTNAQDNAQIELTDAQTEQTKINTLLGLAAVLGDETVVRLICDILDIDYEEIKSKLPEKDDYLQTALNEVETDEQTAEASNPITTE